MLPAGVRGAEGDEPLDAPVELSLSLSGHENLPIQGLLAYHGGIGAPQKEEGEEAKQ